MIIDLKRFLATEQQYWNELETILKRMENDVAHQMSLEEVKRFHYLYQRACADLAKISTFSHEQQMREYLGALVARAYGEIHTTKAKAHRFSPIHWFMVTFPQTFRRHFKAFLLSLLVMVVGGAFGAVALVIDPEAKKVIMPFPHLQGDPADRVAEEESAKEEDRLSGHKARFSAQLMTHNTKVSIYTMALGMTWGIGTIILLFYNGVILGAVILDYVRAGQTIFLIGWLLPHGAIEIPAILLAGQAGLVLAGALIGWGKRVSIRMRLREVSGDVTTLIFGVAIMLVWAGLIEAFLSQYHEPTIPYAVKISFGVGELLLLVLFLAMSGTRTKRAK